MFFLETVYIMHSTRPKMQAVILDMHSTRHQNLMCIYQNRFIFWGTSSSWSLLWSPKYA